MWSMLKVNSKDTSTALKDVVLVSILSTLNIFHAFLQGFYFWLLASFWLLVYDTIIISCLLWKIAFNMVSNFATNGYIEFFSSNCSFIILID